MELRWRVKKSITGRSTRICCVLRIKRGTVCTYIKSVVKVKSCYDSLLGFLRTPKYERLVRILVQPLLHRFHLVDVVHEHVLDAALQRHG